MWKPIINYEEIYEINEYGDIRNILTGRIISPYLNNKGYKIVDLSKNGTRTKYLVHRLVAIHFVPNPNNHPIVLHKDNIKTNIHYSNLKWGTYSENNSQAIKDGLNNIPKPDNRKHYEIYNENDSIICFGGKSVLETIGCNKNESFLRNVIFRESTIKEGIYTVYKIRRKYPKKLISFE